MSCVSAGLDPLRLVNFLRAVDQRYPLSSEAPYHNSTHAADVLQQIHMLLTAGGLAQVTRHDLLSCG